MSRPLRQLRQWPQAGDAMKKFVLFLAVFALAPLGFAQDHWVATWTAAQQTPRAAAARL